MTGTHHLQLVASLATSNREVSAREGRCPEKENSMRSIENLRALWRLARLQGAWLPLTSLAAGLCSSACGALPESEEVATDSPGQALGHSPSFGESVALSSGAEARTDYTL